MNLSALVFLFNNLACPCLIVIIIRLAGRGSEHYHISLIISYKVQVNWRDWSQRNTIYWVSDLCLNVIFQIQPVFPPRLGLINKNDKLTILWGCNWLRGITPSWAPRSGFEMVAGVNPLVLERVVAPSNPSPISKWRKGLFLVSGDGGCGRCSVIGTRSKALRMMHFTVKVPVPVPVAFWELNGRERAQFSEI